MPNDDMLSRSSISPGVLILLRTADAIYLIPGVGGVSISVAVEHSGQGHLPDAVKRSEEIPMLLPRMLLLANAPDKPAHPW